MQPTNSGRTAIMPFGDRSVLLAHFERMTPALLARANREISSSVGEGVCGADLVQDTYLAAQAHWCQFRGCCSEEVRAWLYAILRRQILRLRRRRKRAMLAMLKLYARRLRSTGREDCLSNCAPPPTHQLEREEEIARMGRLVRDLPLLQRQIIEGRIDRGEKFHELGQRLGLSEDAARMAFGRVIRLLRGHFEMNPALKHHRS